MIATLAASALAVLGTSLVTVESAQPPTIRGAVRLALAWIESTAQPVAGRKGARLFPATAEVPKQLDVSLYTGNSGILVFLENAAAVFDDDSIRALADQTAAGIASLRQTNERGDPWWRHPFPSSGSTALYFGDAGVGHAYLVRARLRGDAAARSEAIAIGDGILSRAQNDEGGVFWDDQNDVIYGAAGTALFLVELAAETNETRFLDAARGVGRWLIAEAAVSEGEIAVKDKTLKAPKLMSWRVPASNMMYVNFSHGTSGIGYALARIAEVTGDTECSDAAIAAGEWLLAQAIRNGDQLRWPIFADQQHCIGSWCHGPPGTARLFLLLHARTGQAKYLDAAIASAVGLMAEAGEPEAVDPHAFPPSLCCGVAGAIDFFCDLYRVTGDTRFKDFALRAGDYLIAGATNDGNGMKWRNGANAHSHGEAQHDVNLMLGASGEALALLRLLTLDLERDPIAHLPDRRVGLSAKPKGGQR